MIIIIEQSVWESTHQDSMDLVELCRLARRECHCLVTRPAWDEQDVGQPLGKWLRKHGWSPAAPSPLTEEIAHALRAGLDRFPHLDQAHTSAIRVVDDAPDWRSGRLSLEVALMLLEHPLKLRMEHEDNDGAFLDRMALPHHRRELKRSLEERWAERENAGGITGIIRRLEDIRHPEDDRNWTKRLRLWVMFDRDANPTDRSRPSADSQRAFELLTDDPLRLPWPVAGHRLRRRSIENYIPIETLRTWWAKGLERPVPVNDRERVRRQAKATALSKLPKSMRYQFNMKKGLAGDVRSDIADSRREELKDGRTALCESDLRGSMPQGFLQALFADLDETDRTMLRDGFRAVHKAWHDDAAITERRLGADGATIAERTALEQERTELLQSLLRRL